MVEKENFHRFCDFLLNIGTKVLREVFLDKCVGTSTLASYLAKNKRQLARIQPDKLRKEDFVLLYPSRGGAPVIDDLDITLLCVLFRNLDTQTNPYDLVWTEPKTCQTYQADITRIRLARNVLIGHVKSASMSNTTYNDEVRKLTTVYHRLVKSLPVGRMSSTELQEMIDQELTGPLQINLDREVKGLEKKLLERYKYDEDFIKTVEANREEISKAVRGLSENQEDMEQKLKCLQESQLKKSKQWDSLSRENKDVNMDKMNRRIALTKYVLDEHRDHAGKFFVETEQYRTGQKILYDHGKILITGKRGQGKTYLAYQLLFKFIEDKKCVRPLIISNAKEWMKLADSSTELCIVVDDMCGKHDLMQSELKNWNENSRFLSAVIAKRIHTVIFTMRTHIHEETAVYLHPESNMSDLLCCRNITLQLENESMMLRESDKITFATRYLKDFGLNENEVLQLCRINQTSVGFPLLCSLGQRLEDKSELFDLFTRPLEIMFREIELLRNEKSISYGSLVLVVLAGGILTLESIDEYSATSDRKKDIKLIFDSYAGPSVKLADIQQAANTLCGTFLLFNDSDESYSFIHDTTEEAIFLSYGKLHQQETLKLSSIRSLCKLCRMHDESQGSDAQASPLMLVLRPQYHGVLIERFIKALEMKVPGDFASIAEASLWSSDHFRKMFMDECTTIHVLADTNQNSLLVHAANANNCDLASELLRGMKQICSENLQQAVSYLPKATKASCVHKDLSLFKQFVKEGYGNNNDILSLTVEIGSEDAMAFLLQNGADVNYRSENGESLLHTACLHGKLNMVKVLQSKYSQSVNQCDNMGRSVCHSVASGGNVDILNFLVQKGADPLCKDDHGMNLLHYACINGEKEMAFHLMDNYSVMLCDVAMGGLTVFHCAAFGGSIDILNKVCKLMNSRLNAPSQGNFGYFKYILNRLYPLANVLSQTSPSQHSDYKRCSEENESNHEKQTNLTARMKREETLLHMGSRLEMTERLVEKYPDEVDDCNGNPALYAAQSSNIFSLQYFMHKDINPWCRTAMQETLLHMSCLEGHLEMTQYLVEKYPDMTNEVTIYKGTPVHYAARSGNVTVLQYLIDQGLDPLSRTATQETLLHISCSAGQLKMTQYLVQKYPDMISTVDFLQLTLAHHAAVGSNVSVLQYLIEQGLDPRCRSSAQLTLLHRSCMFHQLEMIQYFMMYKVINSDETLVRYTADMSNISFLEDLMKQELYQFYRKYMPETIFHQQYPSGQIEIIQYLVQKFPDMINEVDICKATPGHYLAQSDNVSVLQYLIDHGLDPWCRTATQQTLLHMSCMMEQLEMTQYLIQKYPDMIKVTDVNKCTPAHYAASSGNVSILQCLIDHDLDPCCRTSNKQTLLHMSCMMGQLEMTRCLIQKYHDMIKVVDISKCTPAHYAASSGNISILECLLDNGLSAWSRTTTKQTLLHVSCMMGQLEMTQYLIQKYPEMIKHSDNNIATPAHYAACSDNVSVLQYLINQGLDPWCRTSTQITLLHMSCMKGKLNMTQYLVEKYPDMVSVVDKYKGTPAHYAAFSGNVSVLQYLIDRGLDPWFRTATQETLLHLSCIAGQLKMTQYLLQKYPDMINTVDIHQLTPAHHAAISSNVSVLQYLIEQGLDPRCRSSAQQTLLHASCMKFQIEMIQRLLQKYPDMIETFMNAREAIVRSAAHISKLSILEGLMNKGLDPVIRKYIQETMLHQWYPAAQLEMIQYLVQTFPDMINEVDIFKFTPAHYLVQNSSVSILQYLIDHGLDPWCRTSEQKTLLHMACITGQLEMTQYLVEKYPDMISEVDNCKLTPGHYAAQSNNILLLQYLIDKGLDPWCRTSEQETLLHISCMMGQLEMTQYLAEKYPDMISEVDNCKLTPGHYAAQNSNILLLQYLIDKGLDPWCRTSEEETLLHMSCMMGQLEMTQYLVQKYPDMINEVDNCKLTPGHYAAQSSNILLLQYLIDIGLDPWCRTSEEETLLHMSCMMGQLEMTQYLAEKYPDMINEVDNCKLTPGHYAAQNSNILLLQYLIDKGLDPWCRTSEEETLLHMSCMMGQLEMTQYLVEKYPDMISEVDNCKITPGHYAAQNSNILLLQYLINKGLDPWCRTSEQKTLLHMSCMMGQLEMTQYLVEKYPDMINKVDDFKLIPAHYAARSSNVLLLQYLIDKGLDPWCRTVAQKTLLHMSCMMGQLEMTQYLVGKYPDMINEVDNLKLIPAHYAARSSNVLLLQYLIDKGLDPWCRTSEQETLLHMACITGQLEMTQYLVEKYPDMINEVDNCKLTPAHYAAQSSNILLLQYLINKGLDPWCRTVTQKSLLHMSCMIGQLEMTQYLVEKYPDMISEADNLNLIPAHYAAQSSNVLLLQYLIDHGLDPRCRTSEQETLLHMACITGQLEMTQYLVEKYPDMINEVDDCKLTPAHYAAHSSNILLLQYLIDKGLDPWCRTFTRQTLLHMACITGQLEMTQYLVEKYPDMINKVDDFKLIPAHYAAQSSSILLLQYLIDKGLDPWCRTVTQQTLLHMACITGQLEMTQYLVEKYPDMINEVDNCKLTPGHYAARSSNVLLLQYLIDKGLDPWCRTSEQETLLHISCMMGQLEMTQYLVEKYPDMISFF